MSEKIVDMDEVLERVDGDRELFFELIDIFEEDYQEKMKEVDECIKKENFDRIKEIAHSLKGSSGNISAKKIYFSFKELEQLAAGKDVGKINTIVSELSQQFPELQTHILQLREEFKKSS